MSTNDAVQTVFGENLFRIFTEMASNTRVEHNLVRV